MHNCNEENVILYYIMSTLTLKIQEIFFHERFSDSIALSSGAHYDILMLITHA